MHGACSMSDTYIYVYIVIAFRSSPAHRSCRFTMSENNDVSHAVEAPKAMLFLYEGKSPVLVHTHIHVPKVAHPPKNAAHVPKVIAPPRNTCSVNNAETLDPNASKVKSEVKSEQGPGTPHPPIVSPPKRVKTEQGAGKPHPPVVPPPPWIKAKTEQGPAGKPHPPMVPPPARVKTEQAAGRPHPPVVPPPTAMKGKIVAQKVKKEQHDADSIEEIAIDDPHM